MVLVVLVGLFIVGEAFSFLVALAAWRWAYRRSRLSINTLVDSSSQTVAILIPVLGAPNELRECLESVRAEGSILKQVVIVLQAASTETRKAVEVWCDSLPGVELLELNAEPNKVNAVLFGLTCVDSEWVILLDADTVLAHGAVNRLLSSIGASDATYGLIVPRLQRESPSFLNHVVAVEKMLSHGLWRLGRFALDLGPNLPGQCYLVRTQVIRKCYRNNLGLLDDVALSACLVAEGCSVSFAPDVIASEHGRSSWSGLLLQRGRYTAGLVKCFVAVYRNGGNRWWAWLCLLVHAWLYYGACIGAVALVIILLLHSMWMSAAILVGSFCLIGFAFAVLAETSLERMGVSRKALWPGWALPLAILILAIFKFVGVGIGLWYLALTSIRPVGPGAYRR